MPSRRNLLALALVLTTGCNPVFGLDKTQPLDAAYFDAPPSQCPPIGTPPMFTQDYQQAVFQSCTDVTLASDGRALALCGGSVSEGKLGERLVDAVGLENPTGVTYDRPRLDPDGRVAIVRMNTTTTSMVQVFERTDTGWTKREDVPSSSTARGISAPTRDGHLLLELFGGIRELVRADDGTWSETQTHSLADLGVASLGDQINISPDGLRLLLIGFTTGPSTQLMYADRATTSDRFSPAQAMPSVEYLPSAFMTEDCSRLYFGALDNVFFTEQAPRM